MMARRQRIIMKAVHPFILFITGGSAAGKTTLYASLRSDSRLAELEIHDMDERGVPAVGRGPWRAFRAQELLYAAGQAFEQGRASVICGNIQPHEIIESPYFKQSYNVHFLYLEISLDTLRKRLAARIKAHEAAGTFDESFNKATYTQAVHANQEFARKVKVSVQNQKNGHILRTATLSKQQMHEKVMLLLRRVGNESR